MAFHATQLPAEELSMSRLAEIGEDELDALIAEKLLNSDAMDDIANAGGADLSVLARAGEGPPAAKQPVRPPRVDHDTYVPAALQIDDEDLPPVPQTNQVVSQSIGADGDIAAIVEMSAKYRRGDGDGDLDDPDEMDNPDGPENDSYHTGPDDPDEADAGGDGSDGPDAAEAAPTFAPRGPKLPDVDTSDAPVAVDENPPTIVNDYANEGTTTGDSKFARITAPVTATGAAALVWAKKQPRGRKITAAVIIVLLVLVMVVVLGGGDDEQPVGTGGSVVDNGSTGAGSDPGSDTTGPTGSAAPLTDLIDSMSGRCADPSTDASLAAVGAEDEAWVCGRPGNYDGALTNITFRRSVTVSSISFTPGFNYVHEPAGDDEWLRHRVVTRVLVRIGGQQITADVIPSRETFTLEFDSPIRTNDGDGENPPAMSIAIQDSVPPEEAMGNSESTDLFGGSGSDVQNATAMQDLVISGTVN
ncbi:hypothetical protein [Corynebacterium sp. AOP12-C2-36]|uniref:hypothetical protein n=1 Tax=Corynebacterium sp. AOP12-C2-36 TaxID=3457723 RepID=UPI0040346C4B